MQTGRKQIVDIILLPIRLFLIVLVTLVDSLLGIIGFLFFWRKYAKSMHYRGWARRLLWVCGIKVEVQGLEKLQDGQSYVFIANHSSYLDIPSIFVAINKPMRIVYKKELEKIPFFGWFLKKSDFIAVNREDTGFSRKTFIEALKLIRENVSVLFFPEGTRSKDGKLGEFKRGAFLLASKSGKPIVPVAIIGANKLLPRGSAFIRSGKIKVFIGDTIDLTQVDDFAQKASLLSYNWINSKIEQYDEFKTEEIKA